MRSGLKEGLPREQILTLNTKPSAYANAMTTERTRVNGSKGIQVSGIDCKNVLKDLLVQNLIQSQES